MGDRGNIVVRQMAGTNVDDVWFYTHSRGSEIGDVVARALAKRWRWDQPDYLARIIFDELTEREGGELGFGISTRMSDNEHDIVVVDVPNQQVFSVSEDWLEPNGRLPDVITEGAKIVGGVKSFEDFCSWVTGGKAVAS